MKFVKLNGSNYSNGLKLGVYWKTFLSKRISMMKKIQKDNKIGDNVLNSRLKRFREILKSIAPAWLEDAKGVSDGARLDIDDYLKINCLPLDFFSVRKAGNCTSFISIGKKHNMLFKIRDERNHPQVFYSKTTDNFHYQVGHDIGNLGVAHFFSSRGIAGANNTGSVTDDVTEDPALSDCHILRYIAENARTVDDAPVLMEKLISKRVAGGAGKKRGSIILLVDNEKGIILESTSKNFTYKFVDKGLVTVSNHFILPESQKWETDAPNKNTLLRKKRIDEIMKGHSVMNEEDLKFIFNMSRDRKHLPHSLCNDDLEHFWMTISVHLQLIDRKKPDASVNYACCGNSRNSFFLPFPIRETENFEHLMSGKYYLASDILYKRFNCRNHMKKVQEEIEKRTVSEGDNYSTLYSDAYSILKSHSKK